MDPVEQRAREKQLVLQSVNDNCANNKVTLQYCSAEYKIGGLERRGVLFVALRDPGMVKVFVTIKSHGVKEHDTTQPRL